MSKALLQRPNFIVKNGRPKAVILDLREYQNLLERAEVRGDLAELKKIKRGKLSFRILDKYAASKV